MGRLTSACALLTAILVIAGVGMLYALSPTSISGQSGDPDDQWEGVDDIRLAVQLEQSVNDVLPGEQIEYTATIENRTGKQQANLVMKKIIVTDGNAVSYVADSTFVRYSEGEPEVPWGTPVAPGRELASLSRFVFPDLAPSIAPNQTIQIRWSLKVGECALRNQWLQVGIAASTDGTERALAEVRTYIAPHADIMATRHFSAAYNVHPTNPAPGETVRHTIRIVNDGNVVLDDWIVHVVDDVTDSRFPLAAEDVQFYIVPERGGAPFRFVAVDGYRFSHPQDGFGLDYLNPGNVLVLAWTERVAPDVPIGTLIIRTFSIETGSLPQSRWLWLGRGFEVWPTRNDFSVEIETADPGYLESTYLPGDSIRMRVIITNRTETARNDVRVTLDLPTALSYVDDSGAYATPRFTAGNSRRLPDTWIDDGTVLPTIEPGNTTIITFNAKVRDNASPGEGLDVYATLESPDDPTELHAGTQIKVAEDPDMDITLRDEEPVEAGDQVTFNITVHNPGQVPLIGAKFGVQETCTGINYVPGTFWIESDRSVLRDDALILQQQVQGEDISVPLGDGNLDPDETVSIRMTFQVADNLDPGTVAGPHFIVTAESTDTTLVPWVGDSWRTEIVVTDPDEPFVTAAELEAARDEILSDIKELAVDIRDTGKRTVELVDETKDLAGRIGDNTEAIQGQADAIFDQVSEVNPWGLGWKWVLLWGGFGALASLIAGFAVWFVLPPTLWHALVRLRERRRRGKNPYLVAPATPSALGSLGQWALAAVRAIGALVATATDRVRDWVGGLRRR